MSKLKIDKKAPWLVGAIVALIVVVGFSFRVAYSLRAGPLIRGDDPDKYLLIARNLIEGDGYATVGGQPTAYRPPMYPVFLASTMLIFQGSMKAVALVQALLAALTIAGAYGVARTLAGRAAGIAAAIIAALDPFQVAMSGQAMTETLFGFFLVTGVFFLVTSIPRPSLMRALLAAFAIALAGMTRPVGWALAAMPIFLCLLREGTVLRRVGRALLVVAVCGVVAVPWIVRNWVRFHAFIPTTTNGGYTFYLGNNQYLRDAVRWRDGVWLPGEPTFDAFEEEVARLRQGKDELSFDALMWDKGLSYVRTHPGEAWRLAQAKFAFFWRLAPSRSSVHGPVSDVVRRPMAIFSLALYIASSIGLILVFRNGRNLVVMLYPALLLCMTHTVFWSQLRFRIPLHPLMAALAGVAISAFYLRLRRKDRQTCAA